MHPKNSKKVQKAMKDVLDDWEKRFKEDPEKLRKEFDEMKPGPISEVIKNFVTDDNLALKDMKEEFEEYPVIKPKHTDELLNSKPPTDTPYNYREDHLTNPFKKGDRVFIGGHASCRCWFAGGIIRVVLEVDDNSIYFKCPGRCNGAKHFKNGWSDVHHMQCRKAK